MMLGAQSVRPDMKVKIIWVNTWYDPGKEAAAARALADQGADFLTQHTDSAAATQFANERGIFSFGQDSDQIKFGPKAQLTAIVNNWTPYYVDRIKLALDRQVGDRRRVGRAQFQDRADGALYQHAGRREEARDGYRGRDRRRQAASVQVSGASTGRQAGRVQGRRHLDDGQILGMNFYIKGIDDKLPGSERIPP
jgi:simple sugar transport system substrate-binding protein